MHFRPFNGNHCQVPVTHRGALTPEVKDYLVFVAASLRIWKKAKANRDRTLFACPEMGPYGLGTGRSGVNLPCLPPAWTDAIALRPEIAAVDLTTPCLISARFGKRAAHRIKDFAIGAFWVARRTVN
jgi:hypothetical protein